MKPLRIALLAALSGPALFADTVYINETFETDTIGVAPTDPAQLRAVLSTVATGSGAIGTSKVANLNDNLTNSGVSLEYNVSEAPLSSLYVAFDLLNIAPNASGSAANALIFSVGNWNTSTSTAFNSNTNRSLGLEFYGTGASSTLKLRTGGSVITTSYTLTDLQSVEIFINDHDTNTLDYIRPDTSTTGTLSANSVVVFINDLLIGSETSEGVVMSTASGLGNTTGDATIGRLGFNSTTSVLNNFLLDNFLVSTIPSAVPEPASFATLMGVAAIGFGFSRRRRTA